MSAQVYIGCGIIVNDTGVLCTKFTNVGLSLGSFHCQVEKCICYKHTFWGYAANSIEISATLSSAMMLKG